MKKIAIDITHFDKLSGYWVVTRNIVKWLLENDTENFYYLFSNESKNIESLKEFKNFKFINTNDSFIKYKFFKLSKYLKENNIDIFFSLDQTLPFKKVCKYIVIEHDIWMQKLWKKTLLKILFSKDFFLWLYHLLDIEKYHLKKADFIITPTNYVKNDIIKYYNLDESKIKVINWWINHLLKKADLVKKENYILFPYIHNSLFVEDLANKIIEKWLVDKIILLRYWKDFQNPKIIDINKTIYPNENIDYYSKALLSIYISLNEWFWIVPPESMYYWTPVIFNNNTCLEEVSSWWWIMLNELNIDLFISEIEKLLNDNEYYNDIVTKWYNHIEKYTWENAIEKIKSLF